MPLQRLRSGFSATLGRAGAVVSASSVLAAGVAFAVNLLMARSLGPDSRGDVALLLSVAYFVTPVTLLGVDRLVLRQGGVGPAHLGGFVLVLNVVATAGLSIVLGWSAVVVGAVSLCGAMTVVARARALHSGHVRTFALLFVSQQAGILLTSVGLFVAGVTDWRLWALGYCLSAPVFAVVELRSALRRDALPVGRLALTLLPGAVAALVVTRVDRVLLGSLGGAYELGLYVTVATATEPVFWISQALADRRSSAAHDRTGRLAVDVAVFTATSTVLSVALWFAVEPLFGPQFAPAKAFIVPLGVAGILLALYRQGIAALVRSASPRRASVVELATAAVALAVYAVTVTRWGAAGAAWGSAVVYLVGLLASRAAGRGLAPAVPSRPVEGPARSDPRGTVAAPALPVTQPARAEP